MTKSSLGLIGWLLASLATGAAGALATRHAREFYAGLVKPSWAPPGWLFGPVWTTLYVLMGVAAWLVWQRAGALRQARRPLVLFAAQLVLNAAWSLLFFGLHRIGWAWAEILVLWLAILAT